MTRASTSSLGPAGSVACWVLAASILGAGCRPKGGPDPASMHGEERRDGVEGAPQVVASAPVPSVSASTDGASASEPWPSRPPVTRLTLGSQGALVPREERLVDKPDCHVTFRWPMWTGVRSDASNDLNRALAKAARFDVAQPRSICDGPARPEVQRKIDVVYDLEASSNSSFAVTFEMEYDAGGAHPSEGLRCLVAHLPTGELRPLWAWLDDQEQRALVTTYVRAGGDSSDARSLLAESPLCVTPNRDVQLVPCAGAPRCSREFMTHGPRLSRAEMAGVVARAPIGELFR